jgi:hypothetical protein
MLGRQIEKWTTYLVRRGWRESLTRGGTFWPVVTMVAWLVRLLARPDPPRRATEYLRLGDAVLVRSRKRPRRGEIW